MTRVSLGIFSVDERGYVGSPHISTSVRALMTHLGPADPVMLPATIAGVSGRLPTTEELAAHASIRDGIDQLARTHGQALDVACQAALDAGVGVAVVDEPGTLPAGPLLYGDTIKVTSTTTVGPHPAVPAGQILRFPSRRAFELYVDRLADSMICTAEGCTNRVEGLFDVDGQVETECCEHREI